MGGIDGGGFEGARLFFLVYTLSPFFLLRTSSTCEGRLSPTCQIISWWLFLLLILQPNNPLTHQSTNHLLLKKRFLAPLELGKSERRSIEPFLLLLFLFLSSIDQLEDIHPVTSEQFRAFNQILFIFNAILRSWPSSPLTFPLSPSIHPSIHLSPLRLSFLPPFPYPSSSIPIHPSQTLPRPLACSFRHPQISTIPIVDNTAETRIDNFHRTLRILASLILLFFLFFLFKALVSLNWMECIG